MYNKNTDYQNSGRQVLLRRAVSPVWRQESAFVYDVEADSFVCSGRIHLCND